MKLFIFLLTLVEKKLKLKLEQNRMKKWEWEISFQWTINFSLTTTALTLTEGKKVKDYSGTCALEELLQQQSVEKIHCIEPVWCFCIWSHLLLTS